MVAFMQRILSFVFLLTWAVTGCRTASDGGARVWPRHTLQADQITLLNLPQGQQFDASGLCLMPSGEMLTQRNNFDALLFRLEFLPGGREANVIPLRDCFSIQGLLKISPDGKPFDCEGIARDEQGRFHLCEERRRWIIRCDPNTGTTERLDIDWASVREYFSAMDPNASFEGLAIGNGTLYVANERSSPVIVEVDLKSLRVKGSFVVQPAKSSFFGLHYSDLCWFENHLWVLCRQHRVVLQVDPRTRRVVAEYDYGEIESSLGYRTGLPVGLMEGLAVSRESIWIVTDNNGDSRGRTGKDRRPALVRCPRPALSR